jgi:hypothetical protein
MKKSFLLCLFLVAIAGFSKAQSFDEGYFSYFTKTKPGDIDTTTKVGDYEGYLQARTIVTDDPDFAKKLYRIAKELKSNGSGDINKCFIPRHAVQLYNKGRLVYTMLICFECDGVRFSDEGSETKAVKKVAKRENLMKELKELFLQYHYNENGPAVPVKM